MLAALIDLICISPVLIATVLIAARATELPLADVLNRPEMLLELLIWGGPAFYGLLGVCFVSGLLYTMVFVALTGHTPGLRLTGSRVISVYGDRPGFGRTLVRCIGLILAMLPLGLGLLWVAFDRERRGLQDYIAGTYVISRRPASRAEATAPTVDDPPQLAGAR